jgi:hypothetical protein
MAIIGTACSSTSQASMPPGLFTVWIFMAFAGKLKTVRKATASVASDAARAVGRNAAR